MCCIVVVSPLKAHRFCTLKNATIALSILCISTFIVSSSLLPVNDITLNSFYLLNENRTYHYCGVSSVTGLEYLHYFGSVVPYLILLVEVIITLVYFRRSLQFRQQNSTSRRSATSMTLADSIASLFLSAPSVIMTVAATFFIHASWNGYMSIFISFVDWSSYLNYAINIVLYCVSGSKFRRAFLELFGKCKCKCCKRELEIEQQFPLRRLQR